MITLARACARTGCDEHVPSARATYCSGACQKAVARARSRGEMGDGRNVVGLPRVGAISSVVAATRTELAAAGRLDNYLGQAALAAAERLDGSRAVQGYAAMLKEYRDTMREAVADVEQHADTADELRTAALRLIGGA